MTGQSSVYSQMEGCGEPWNFAKWSMEFGKICRGKL